MAWTRHAAHPGAGSWSSRLVRQVEAAVALLGDLDAGAARGAPTLFFRAEAPRPADAAARRAAAAARVAAELSTPE